ncbi:hypothetical protein CPB97_006433 [Podila verticillata]|nr:hypothetical protein CPB97_006433 [Podila verticillata]
MVNILYDGEWNPQVDLLAQDCAHSFGQTEQAMVYRPLTKAGSDNHPCPNRLEQWARAVPLDTFK